MADVGSLSTDSLLALPAALKHIPNEDGSFMIVLLSKAHQKSTRLWVCVSYLCMQNAGSKYLKPRSGPREQPVTNLK